MVGSARLGTPVPYLSLHSCLGYSHAGPPPKRMPPGQGVITSGTISDGKQVHRIFSLIVSLRIEFNPAAAADRSPWTCAAGQSTQTTPTRTSHPHSRKRPPFCRQPDHPGSNQTDDSPSKYFHVFSQLSGNHRYRSDLACHPRGRSSPEQKGQH